MADLIPAAFTWTAVSTEAAALIANTTVTTMLSVVIGIPLALRVIRALKGAAR